MFFQEVVKDERYEEKIQLCDNIIKGGHINSAKLQEGTESEIHICCVVGYNTSSRASLSEEKGEGMAYLPVLQVCGMDLYSIENVVGCRLCCS